MSKTNRASTCHSRIHAYGGPREAAQAHSTAWQLSSFRSNVEVLGSESSFEFNSFDSRRRGQDMHFHKKVNVCDACRADLGTPGGGVKYPLQVGPRGGRL